MRPINVIEYSVFAVLNNFNVEGELSILQN